MSISFGPNICAVQYMEKNAPVETVLHVIGIDSKRIADEVRRHFVLELNWDRSIVSGREAFIRDIRKFAGEAWSHITVDHWGAVYDTLPNLARSYANYVISMDPDMLEASPACELLPENSKDPWPQWWIDAGGILYEGRMIARKTDPVWAKLSDFGLPFPPFIIGSKAIIKDLLRTEIDRLGLTSSD